MKSVSPQSNVQSAQRQTTLSMDHARILALKELILQTPNVLIVLILALLAFQQLNVIPAFKGSPLTIQHAKLFVLLATLSTMKINVRNVPHSVPPAPTTQMNAELVMKAII